MTKPRRKQQQQVTRRIRRERRWLGRFVVFAEMEADLTPILLFEPPSPSKGHGLAPSHASNPGSASEEV